jgi:hypothetical protein
MRKLLTLLTVNGLLLFAQAGGWTALIDGKGLAGWDRIGDANWKYDLGVIEATNGDGYLMTPGTYKDVEIRAEFWVDEPANSGVFVRCQSRASVTSANCYEVNVYDKRPDPKYATGAIVDVAPPLQKMTAAGKWNTFEITAKGGHLVVVLNGTKTVDVQDAKFAEGTIAIQRTAGTVRFRKLEIRPI